MNEPLITIPPARLRTMRILNLSLIWGAVAVCAVAVYVVYDNNGQGIWGPQALPLVSLIAAGMTCIQVVVSFTLPATLLRKGLNRMTTAARHPGAGVAGLPSDDTVNQLLLLRQSSMIVGLAMLNGSSLFCSIAYLVEGQPYVLIGTAVTLGLMVARLPTEGGLRIWLERQVDEVRQAHDEADIARR
jgi:hypothetical protein